MKPRNEYELALNAPQWKLLLGALVLWTAGCSLLIYYHLSHTLAKAHFQFILLLPPVIAMLLNLRASSGELLARTPAPWAPALLALPIAGLGVASWFFSPWLAMASLVLLLPVATLVLGGWPLLRSTWGIWLVTLFYLPPPFQSDERMIVYLRNRATTATSRILDHFDVVHLVSGNIIDLPEKTLFVADACSGIHSLFVLLAAAACISAYHRRGPIATAVLLAATLGFVMIENVLRLLAVSLSVGYGYDLTTGIGHQSLGIGLFVFSLAMLVSTDQLIAVFKLASSQFAESRTSAKRQSIDGASQRSLLVCGAVTLMLLPIQFWKKPVETPSIIAGFRSELALPSFGEEFLPKDFMNFTRTEYEEVVRVPDDPFARRSQIWRYTSKRGDQQVLFYLNYTYPDPHDACLCYRNVGWELGTEQVLGVTDTGGFEFYAPVATSWNQTPAVQVAMKHPLDGEGLLLYSLVSESGKFAATISSRKLGTTSGQAAGRFATIVAPPPPSPEQYIQLQMVTLQSQSFNDQEIQQLRQGFRQIQQALFTRCLNELGM